MAAKGPQESARQSPECLSHAWRRYFTGPRFLGPRLRFLQPINWPDALRRTALQELAKDAPSWGGRWPELTLTERRALGPDWRPLAASIRQAKDFGQSLNGHAAVFARDLADHAADFARGLGDRAGDFLEGLGDGLWPFLAALTSAEFVDAVPAQAFDRALSNPDFLRSLSFRSQASDALTTLGAHRWERVVDRLGLEPVLRACAPAEELALSLDDALPMFLESLGADGAQRFWASEPKLCERWLAHQPSDFIALYGLEVEVLLAAFGRQSRDFARFLKPQVEACLSPDEVDVEALARGLASEARELARGLGPKVFDLAVVLGERGQDFARGLGPRNEAWARGLSTHAEDFGRGLGGDAWSYARGLGQNAQAFGQGLGRFAEPFVEALGAGLEPFFMGLGSFEAEFARGLKPRIRRRWRLAVKDFEPLKDSHRLRVRPKSRTNCSLCHSPFEAWERVLQCPRCGTLAHWPCLYELSRRRCPHDQHPARNFRKVPARLS